jgi:hypothetical protein
MMNGDIYQSDLREFDSWLRGQIMGWLKIPGIATEVFLMSWRDGGFTLPSLEERHYTMTIRTLLDVMSTTDQDHPDATRCDEYDGPRECSRKKKQNDTAVKL